MLLPLQVLILQAVHHGAVHQVHHGLEVAVLVAVVALVAEVVLVAAVDLAGNAITR